MSRCIALRLSCRRDSFGAKRTVQAIPLSPHGLGRYEIYTENFLVKPEIGTDRFVEALPLSNSAKLIVAAGTSVSTAGRLKLLHLSTNLDGNRNSGYCINFIYLTWASVVLS